MLQDEQISSSWKEAESWEKKIVDIISPITAQTWKSYFEKMVPKNTEEIREAYKSVKNVRTPGLWNIVGGLIKSESVKLYCQLSLTFINKSDVLDDWKLFYIST